MLFVLGLVIWLATLGIFDNPLIVAVALGVGNAVVLAGGWAIIRFSRYQTAGRAITLLACLVMPLNLWFYHAQKLVTLGGQLWVAALVCCVLYLASALVLRDHVFVYVLGGGMAMTGLLMLAHADKFWEIASPAAMLVVLGLISIHVERAFPEIEGPFSRRRFGMAFFQSGQVLLAAGLLLVLGAQLAGDWLYRPLFEPLYQRWQSGPPAIVAERWGQFLALALVLAGSYAYFYSDIVVRRVGLYVYLAVFTLLWAEMLVIELLAIRRDRGSRHHRVGPDGFGRQPRPAQAAPVARAVRRRRPNPAASPPRPCRWCGQGNRWACSSAPSPCCSAWSSICGPPTSR